MQFLLYLLVLAGLLDSGYLTYEHFFGQDVLCPLHNPWIACGRVLDSPYAMIGPIPLALLGMVHYFVLFVWFVLWFKTHNKIFAIFLKLQTLIGVFFSAYLVYLQAYVIKAFCVYCLISAGVSLLVWLLVWTRSRRQLQTPTVPVGKSASL